MSIIRRMVLNPVAANMLMLLILGGGLAAAMMVPRELFPEFDVNYITVTVPYPSASPSDVEKSICLKIEDDLAGLDGIKEITSTSSEGVGTVALELKTGADVRKVLDDVKSKVDSIDFDSDEDPITTEITIRKHIINVALGIGGNKKGRLPDISEEHTLKELAEDIRDEINDLPEISQVTIFGLRDYEIVVEVPEESLRHYDLTLGQIARAIRQSSFDLPVGSVKTRSGELTIRIAAQKDTAEEYKKIVLLSQPDGAIVRLGDIAKVSEGFEDVDVGGLFNGRSAVMISVYKTSDEDSIKIAEAVRRYVERKKKRASRWCYAGHMVGFIQTYPGPPRHARSQRPVGAGAGIPYFVVVPERPSVGMGGDGYPRFPSGDDFCAAHVRSDAEYDEHVRVDNGAGVDRR